MRRIYDHRLTSTSGGNVSSRNSQGVWITAASVDKGLLTEKDVALIDLNGALLCGPRPSSEWPFHVAIYQARSDIRAIVHAHSTALVAASLIDEEIDTRLIPSCFQACGPMGRTRYFVPGTAELGGALAYEFSQGFQCVSMQNHGIVIGAESLARAFSRLEILEISMRSMFTARAIGTMRSPILKSEPDEVLSDWTTSDSVPCDPAPQATHPSPTAAVTAESEQVATEVVRFAARGSRWQLLQSGRGAVSARCGWGAPRFLITAQNCDFAELAAEQLISYEIRERHPPCPSGLTQLLDHPCLHQAIYAACPAISAIIHAHPPCATAFSLIQMDRLPVTIPESYIVLGHVPILDPRAGDERMVAQIVLAVSAVEDPQPAVVIAREGVLVMGRSLLEAFDRLEVLESTAETVVQAMRLGKMQALTDVQLATLQSIRRSHSISEPEADRGNC